MSDDWFDKTYRSDEKSPADLDARMTEVANQTRSFDEYTIAMLTALNLASELQQLRQHVASRLGEFDRDIASITAMLEAVLPDDESSS